MKTLQDNPTPFNNSDLQHLIHEINRLTSTIIIYSDHMMINYVQQNDSRIYTINEYCKSIRKEVDVYYQAVKDNYDVNAKLSEQLSALQQENEKLRKEIFGLRQAHADNGYVTQIHPGPSTIVKP